MDAPRGMDRLRYWSGREFPCRKLETRLAVGPKKKETRSITASVRQNAIKACHDLMSPPITFPAEIERSTISRSPTIQ